jgi:hypothetical protein
MRDRLLRWPLTDRDESWVVRGWLVLVCITTLVLYWDGLSAGFLADDLFHISMLEGLFGDYSIWHLYAFAPEDPASTARHIERGSLPWWTHPEFRFVMLRPLSSLLIAFDHAAFPRQPFLHHLHTMVWFFAVLVLTFRMLRIATSTPIALIAIASFAVDETMTWMVAWLANRCALVSTVFVMLAIAVHLRAPSQHPWSRDRKLELALWALAFSGGEYAVGGVALLCGYEFAGRHAPWRERVLALWPAVSVMLVFVSAYVAIRGGVYGATTYIDPFTDTAQFLKSAADRLPRMAGEVWVNMNGESERFYLRYQGSGLAQWVMPDDGSDILVQAWRHARFVMSLTAILVLPAWWLARRHLTAHERRGIKWLVVGATLALVPVSAIPPATRSLLLANLAAAVFVGAVTVAAIRAWRARIPRQPGPWIARILLAVWALAILYVHVWREWTYVGQQQSALLSAKHSYEKFYANAHFGEHPVGGKHVVVIATSGLVTGIHGVSMMNVLGYELPKTWHVLAMGPRGYTVRKLGPRTLEVAAVGGTMHWTPEEALFRSPADALLQGDTVDAGVFKAKVIADHGGIGPSSVVFKFKYTLDDPRFAFLVVGPQGLQPFAIPPRGKMIAVHPPTLPFATPRG